VRVLKEPLFHFLLLGVVLFAALGGFAGVEESSSPQGTIIVTQARIRGLAETFARTWQRPPSEDELDRLVRDYVREEVSYREALALGLDRDDAIIRRRLQQKLEFVSQDIAEQSEPSEEDLRAYLDAHAQAFERPATLSFAQVFLDPERHRGTLDVDTAALLGELNRGGDEADVALLGDPTLLEHQLADAPVEKISDLFGADFAASVAALPIGSWQGPITSAYGTHLVRVTERTEARRPQLDEVRDAVELEWRNARAAEAREQLYQSLLQSYAVEIERDPKEARSSS
jgi:hypothetical protein